MEYPDWGSSSHGRDGWTPAGTWSAVGPPEDNPGGWLRPTGHGAFGRDPRQAPASEDPRSRRRPGQAPEGGWYAHPPRHSGPPSQRRLGRDAADQLGEDDEPSGRGYLAALLATAAWYLAPVALYLLWTLTLGSTQDASCVETSGAPCIAPRSEALTTLVDSAPQLGTALALSLTLALTLRWMTSTWRTVAVGFAAAVVGAGVTTVVFSLFT